MPCLATPIPALPTLPAPFSLALPTPPSLSFNPQWCCKLPTFSTPPIPPIPPIVVNPAAVASILSSMNVVLQYLKAIPIKCPREA